MDELKLKLSTRFMKTIVANLVSKAIFKKFGYEANIQINEIEIKTEEDKINIHVNLDGKVNNSEFVKIIKSIGLD